MYSDEEEEEEDIDQEGWRNSDWGRSTWLLRYSPGNDLSPGLERVVEEMLFPIQGMSETRLPPTPDCVAFNGSQYNSHGPAPGEKVAGEMPEDRGTASVESHRTEQTDTIGDAGCGGTPNFRHCSQGAVLAAIWATWVEISVPSVWLLDDSVDRESMEVDG
jgi:hypothetical protein